MRENPADWEKENIRLCEDEAGDREFLRIKTEAGSDSEVLRQALRNLEQLVDDTGQGTKFFVQPRNGDKFVVSPASFEDSGDNETMLRRSLILHKASKERINNLKDKLNLEDISAVARIALRFFFLIAKNATSGAKFLVEDNQGHSKEVRFGFFVEEKGSSPSPRRPKLDLVPKPIRTAARATFRPGFR